MKEQVQKISISREELQHFRGEFADLEDTLTWDVEAMNWTWSRMVEDPDVGQEEGRWVLKYLLEAVDKKINKLGELNKAFEQKIKSLGDAEIGVVSDGR